MLRKLASVFLLLLSFLSWFLFYSHYWRHRHLFNDEGSYFDAAEGVVFHSQNGMAWGLIAIVIFLSALFLTFRKGNP